MWSCCDIDDTDIDDTDIDDADGAKPKSEYYGLKDKSSVFGLWRTTPLLKISTSARAERSRAPLAPGTCRCTTTPDRNNILLVHALMFHVLLLLPLRCYYFDVPCFATTSMLHAFLLCCSMFSCFDAPPPPTQSCCVYPQRYVVFKNACKCVNGFCQRWTR